MRRRRLVGKGTKGIPLKFIGRLYMPVVGIFVLVCHLKRHGQARSILLYRDHSLVRIDLLLRVKMRYFGAAVSARERQMDMAIYQAGRQARTPNLYHLIWHCPSFGKGSVILKAPFKWSFLNDSPSHVRRKLPFCVFGKPKKNSEKKETKAERK